LRLRRLGNGVQVVVVGSVGLDTIETPFERREGLLGGSLSYACTAAAFFSKVGMVGIVGDDFPREYVALYRRAGIDLGGLAEARGKTFRWSGVYAPDMISRRTLCTELNVFESFSPEIPDAYCRAPFLLLGNISPELQLRVLAQMKRPRFTVADTMDLWINIARDDLLRVIAKVNMLMLNDGEARLLTGEHNLRQCAETIAEWGPEYVLIKKGEHGAMLVSKAGVWLVPAYPVEAVRDPTGAGDSFAGGFLGRLAAGGKVTTPAVREALLYGAVVASFDVEDFSVGRLQGLKRRHIEARLRELRRMISV
jgi:cytidine kinase